MSKTTYNIGEEVMGKHSDCITKIMEAQRDLKAQLLAVASTFKGSREQSLAAIRMEESCMWLNAALQLITMGEEPSG